MIDGSGDREEPLGLNSSVRAIRALRRHAGLEQTAWPENDVEVGTAMAAAVRDGRTVTLPMTVGRHLVHLTRAVLFALAIWGLIALGFALETPTPAVLFAAGLGPFMLFHAVVAVARSGSLTLDRSGMRVRYAFRTRTWNWSETSGFVRSSDPHEPAQDTGLVWFTSDRPEDTHADVLTFLGVRGLTLTTQIPDRYGLDARTLATVLDRTRTACADGHRPTAPRKTGSRAAALLLNVAGAAAALTAFIALGAHLVSRHDSQVLVGMFVVLAAFMAGLLMLLYRRGVSAWERRRARAARTLRHQGTG